MVDQLAAWLWLNTLSHPSPMSDRNDSIRARYTSASRSWFWVSVVSGGSNTEYDRRWEPLGESGLGMRGDVSDRVSAGSGCSCGQGLSCPSKSTMRFGLRLLCLPITPALGTGETPRGSGDVSWLGNGAGGVRVEDIWTAGNGVRPIFSTREGGVPSRVMDLPSLWKRSKQAVR